jgi:Tat protein secretion system quality control protein TatD with DNase activity
MSDIAVNLTDPMFQGNYRGKQAHAPDLEAVLRRSKDRGVETMIITGTSLDESKEALEMAERYGASFLLLIPMCANSDARRAVRDGWVSSDVDERDLQTR